MHDGFAYTQERTADVILSAVQSALESTRAKKVLVTGHSLGAAIASIDGMMLRMKLDLSIAVTTTVFGLPRVGNKAWADLVDSTVSSSSEDNDAHGYRVLFVSLTARHVVHACHEPA